MVDFVSTNIYFQHFFILQDYSISKIIKFRLEAFFFNEIALLIKL